MSILNILQGRRDRHHRRAAARRHLGLESLETRQVLSTFTVTNLNDAGAGSLRQALISADAAGDAAVINLGSAPQGTISLQGALPDLSNTHGLTINGKTSIHVDLTRANKSDGIAVEVDAGAVGTINNLEFDNAPGRALGNHGTLSLIGDVVTGSRNGAVINYGLMGIANSTLKNNSAVHYGGGVDNTGGYLYLGSSTISGNSAGLLGGGVENYNGTLKVVGSTFTGNTAADGGAIHDAPTKTATTIDSSTFTANSAGFGGGLFFDTLAPKLTNDNIYDDSATYGGSDVSGAVDPTSSNNLIGTGGGMTGISDNNPFDRPYVAGALSNPEYPYSASRPANFIGSDSARIRPVMEQKGSFNGDPASGSYTYDYTVRTNAATLKITSGYLALALDAVVSDDNLHDNNPHYYPDGFVTGMEFADSGTDVYASIDLWQGYDSTSLKNPSLAITEAGTGVADDLTGLPYTFNGAKKS